MNTVFINLTEDLNISVTQDTQYVLGSKTGGEYKVVFNFVKENVTSEILGVFNLSGDTKLSVTTISHHKVPHTTCNTFMKAVLGDSSFFSFSGKIIIDREAQQTSSFLNDSVLVVGENARSKSKPELEISADDVKASHGASTGRIDDSQLYYLQSRGLNIKEAEKLVVEGFLASLISKINEDSVKEEILNTL